MRAQVALLPKREFFMQQKKSSEARRRWTTEGASLVQAPDKSCGDKFVLTYGKIRSWSVRKKNKTGLPSCRSLHSLQTASGWIGQSWSLEQKPEVLYVFVYFYDRCLKWKDQYCLSMQGRIYGERILGCQACQSTVNSEFRNSHDHCDASCTLFHFRQKTSQKTQLTVFFSLLTITSQTTTGGLRIILCYNSEIDRE